MRCNIPNVNIRGREEKTNKNGDPYLLVRFEDETGKPQELVDKMMERKTAYVRDTMGTLHIDIDIKSKWHNVRIVGFTPDQKGETI